MMLSLTSNRQLNHDLMSTIVSDTEYVTLPQNLQLSSGTLYEDFETIGDWTIANGSAAANTTQYKTGAQSIKLTTNAGATATMTKTVNWDLSGDWGGLSFWMYLHNATFADYGTGNLMMLYLSNNSGITNTMRYWIYTNQVPGLLQPGWYRVYVPKAYFGQQGTGTFSSPIIRIRLSVYSAAATVAEISFDDFEVGEKYKPALLLRLDDGTDVHYSTAYAYMKNYNIRGTAYVNTAFFGNAGYLTYAQAQEMNRHGWAIANHTRSHTQLKGLSVADQQTAINDCITDLNANELSRDALYLCYPGGGVAPGYDANTATAMNNLGMLTGHTSHQIMGISATGMGYFPQVLPDQVVGSLLCLRNVSHPSSISLATAQTMLDLSIAAGTIHIPLFHRFDSGGEWTSADFRSYINYVRTKALAGLISIITIADLYKLTLGPVTIWRVK